MGTSGARPQCQPTSRCLIVHFVRLYWQYASVKGAFTAPYFLVAHARRPPAYVYIRLLRRTLPAFFGNNRRKNRGLPVDDVARISLVRDLSLLPFFSSLFPRSQIARITWPEHMFLDIVAAISLI